MTAQKHHGGPLVVAVLGLNRVWLFPKRRGLDVNPREGIYRTIIIGPSRSF